MCVRLFVDQFACFSVFFLEKIVNCDFSCLLLNSATPCTAKASNSRLSTALFQLCDGFILLYSYNVVMLLFVRKWNSCYYNPLTCSYFPFRLLSHATVTECSGCHPPRKELWIFIVSWAPRACRSGHYFVWRRVKLMSFVWRNAN